jgi:glycosyltransferase involved in cell wall biosynthesis
MRFFFLTYAYEEGIRVDTGGFRKIWELARHLNNIGHESWVFIPEIEKPQRDLPAPYVSYPLIEIGILRPLSAYLMLFLKPLFHAFRHKPDFIYLRTAPTILPILLSRLTGAQLILEINGDAFTERRGRSANFWQDRIHYFRVKLICLAEKLNSRAAKVVVTLTDGLQDVIRERYLIPGEKIAVIQSGTNIQHCRPLDKTECRKLLGLEEQNRYVGFVGVLYAHQGLDTLIEATPEVLQACPDVVFLIGGGGPMAEAWQNKVREMNIDGAFRFVGVVPYEELPIFLNAADICIAPFKQDRGETSPLKLFDYMACGKPVVCSDIPSLKSILEATDGILAVRPDDSHALASALITLLNNDTMRAHMGSEGRKYAVNLHSWDVIAHRIIKAIT